MSMHIVNIQDATLRRLQKFVDLWKEYEELNCPASSHLKVWTQLKGWITLEVLRGEPRSVILDALGHNLASTLSEESICMSVAMAMQQARIVFPKGWMMCEIVSMLR